MTQPNDAELEVEELVKADLILKNNNLQEQVVFLSALLWLSLDKRGPLRISRRDMADWDFENRSLSSSDDPQNPGSIIWKAIETKEKSHGATEAIVSPHQPAESGSDYPPAW